MGIEEVSESLMQQTLTTKYKNTAAEEHLKVMTCRSATCRGAGEEKNGIIYQRSFSQVECWMSNGLKRKIMHQRTSANTSTKRKASEWLPEFLSHKPPLRKEMPVNLKAAQSEEKKFSAPCVRFGGMRWNVC